MLPVLVCVKEIPNNGASVSSSKVHRQVCQSLTAAISFSNHEKTEMSEGSY